MSTDGGSPWHLLNFLFIPVTAVFGWVAKQLSSKAEKEDVNRSLNAVTDAIEAMRQERYRMHTENTQRLDAIHQQLLDIVGGRYRRN